MKSHASASKTNRQTTGDPSQHSSAGENAIALAPPDYGIGFVDQGMAAAAPLGPGFGLGSMPWVAAFVQRQSMPEEADLLQRAAPGGSASAGSQAPPIVHEVLRSSGQPLDPYTRAVFEPRFGRDFSRVRVHVGSTAAASAETVDALAYTVGNHVVFGKGRYAPATDAGQNLLAHELTHTVQQEGALFGGSIVIGPPDGPAEQEARQSGTGKIASPRRLDRRRLQRMSVQCLALINRPGRSGPVYARTPTTIQTRLTVRTPGDVQEQEANRLAEQVMRMPEAVPEGECSACSGRSTPGPAHERESEGVQLGLSRKAEGAPPEGDLPASVFTTLNGAGHDLDAGTRRFMESRFGADFEGVRVHTDAQAARSAADVSARAYTIGRHIVFGDGEYSPEGSAGRALIAHELTHVLQQADGGPPRLARQPRPEGAKTDSPVSPEQSIPRPPGIPSDTSVILQPITLPPKLLAAVPEGKATLVLPPNPPGLVGNYGEADTGLGGVPVTAVGAATVENVSATLTTFGFKSAPGGNAIGMIGFPGKGLGWGHTAVYVRIDGKIVMTRGFMPASSLQALMTPGVEAGTSSIPGRIANDTGLFMRDAAQIIEYPVARDAALRAAADLPKPGIPPEGFAQEYTARPGVKGAPGATNCVGFGCEFVESRLGGKVGAEKIGPVMEPANPATEGLQGRFMKASGEGPKGGPLSPMPEAVGPGIRSGMPRSFTVLKWGGRAFLVLGGVLAIVAVVRAPEEEKARTAAVEGGGFLAGVAVGATAGLFCGPGALVCSVVLGLVFGVAGALAGREIADVVYDEAVGDDETVRAWIQSHDREGLSRQAPRTKIQMILALMSGRISGEDVAAIDQICRSVQSSGEAAMVRAAIEPRIVDKMTSIGQRTRVRVSLAAMPR